MIQTTGSYNPQTLKHKLNIVGENLKQDEDAGELREKIKNLSWHDTTSNNNWFSYELHAWISLEIDVRKRPNFAGL